MQRLMNTLHFTVCFLSLQLASCLESHVLGMENFLLSSLFRSIFQEWDILNQNCLTISERIWCSSAPNCNFAHIYYYYFFSVIFKILQISAYLNIQYFFQQVVVSLPNLGKAVIYRVAGLSPTPSPVSSQHKWISDFLATMVYHFLYHINLYQSQCCYADISGRSRG